MSKRQKLREEFSLPIETMVEHFESYDTETQAKIRIEVEKIKRRKAEDHLNKYGVVVTKMALAAIVKFSSKTYDSTEFKIGIRAQSNNHLIRISSDVAFVYTNLKYWLFIIIGLDKVYIDDFSNREQRPILIERTEIEKLGCQNWKKYWLSCVFKMIDLRDVELPFWFTSHGIINFQTIPIKEKRLGFPLRNYKSLEITPLQNLLIYITISFNISSMIMESLFWHSKCLKTDAFILFCWNMPPYNDMLHFTE